ncbi:ead/Ea22-like family protein [Franconibacter helveticus]|uniref:ead/Ea22-like family protein n=1 Tax=Franconibacter helveticus TaxID=357240 RepID=UPI0019550C10|nr:ead/Ea22-like family protein [Franconibacter helveticus]
MTLDIAKLKAAAEKARWGNWSAYKPHKGARGYEVRVGCEAVAQHCLKDDADFIAEASPKVVLELIAALEAAGKDAKQWKEVVEAFCVDDANWHKLTTSNNELISQLSVALCKQADRIAELESRTLRVNMPALRNTEMMSDLAWNSAIDQCFDALIKATDESGINLETGGE